MNHQVAVTQSKINKEWHATKSYILFTLAHTPHTHTLRWILYIFMQRCGMSIHLYSFSWTFFGPLKQPQWICIMATIEIYSVSATKNVTQNNIIHASKELTKRPKKKVASSSKRKKVKSHYSYINVPYAHTHTAKAKVDKNYHLLAQPAMEWAVKEW